MDLYSSAILIAIVITWIVARAYYKRKRRQEAQIFPPDRKNLRVIEVNDIADTF